jgi:Flp pilus assembly protein TadD
VRQLRRESAAADCYAAVSRFLRNDFEGTVLLAERIIAIAPTYAPVYDLVGAAYTKLERRAAAREAFETSLRFNAHGSTAYTNLGLLELSDGNRVAAAGYFAEALWLAPDSATARQASRKLGSAERRSG